MAIVTRTGGIQEMVEGLKDNLSVKRVFGEPYEKDGVTVIPVASFGGGGGGGGGTETDMNQVITAVQVLIVVGALRLREAGPVVCAEPLRRHLLDAAGRPASTRRSALP